MLSFENVSKTFSVSGPEREIMAVRNVNLQVIRGEIVTLVGPSGCGKSTLLNMTAGLMAPSGGILRYKGEPVKGIHSDIGYMTQNDHLLPWRTISKNIEIPLEIRGVGKKERAARVRELMELVGLVKFEGSYPTQVSGGMRKRAALARVLAYNPETLLMDEPFGALDAQLRSRLQSELVHLCRHLDKTVLFVTHDLDEAIALADRCAVFSPRPGTIETVLNIDLPRNRGLDAIRFDPDFLRLTKKLWQMLSESRDSSESTGIAEALPIHGAESM